MPNRDSVPRSIERARNSGPGVGTKPPANTRWCFVCATDKPAKGSKKIGSLFKCADCAGKGKT